MTDRWLQTKQLCRYYRRGPQEVRAVDGVNMNLRRGEYLGIVGASGSGKSTLLNLLAGLDSPTSGDVLIEDIALGSLTRRELSAYRAARVGMVFQSFNLIAHHSAIKNVELALYFDNTPPRERAARAQEVLELLGLGDRLDHRPGDLSGGEQQRVAMARALAKRPDILFADEPTGNLDLENTNQIADLLSRLNRDGLTIVLVTHDLALARKRADSIIRMDYGKLIGEETPASGQDKAV